jgi:surfeit locus 1 family protein
MNVLVIVQDIKKRPTAFIVMILLVVLGIELGRWQLRRADYKISLSAQIAEKGKEPFLLANEKNWSLEQANYHRMQAIGHWLAHEAVWLENRPYPLGQDPKTGINTGFNLLMPLELEGKEKRVLWVNRGWAPRNFNQINAVPNIRSSENQVIVEGIVFPDGGKTFELSKAQDQADSFASDGLKIKENLNLKSEALEHGWNQLPFVLREQNNSSDDSLDKATPQYQSGVSVHYGYAVQWFGLSLMTFLFWAITGYRTRLKSLR